MRILLSVLVGLFMSGQAFAHGGGAGSEVLKESQVAFAGMTALEDFKEIFEKAKGAPLKDELIGFHAVAGGHEVEVGVYHLLSATELAKDAFGCHVHVDGRGLVEDAHCEDEQIQSLAAYKPGARIFSVEEFEKGLSAGVEYFETEFGNPAMIQEIKIWQVNNFLQVSFAWTTPSKKEVRYVGCHYHGGGKVMDCHKRFRPGPNQPKH